MVDIKIHPTDDDDEETMGCIDVAGKLFWECGCITYTIPDPKGRGKMLVHEACDRQELCPVVKSVHDTSNEKDIPIEHYRREEFDKT